jgi:hypothetical protein
VAKLEPWKIRGEMSLSCSCDVFCPCVISLGKHQPTEGHCQAWACFRIDKGHHGDVDLAGLNVGLFIDIPGLMARGNWTAALFIDKRADIYADKAIQKIFSGAAGGSTGLLRILIGQFLGAEQMAIEYRTENGTRHVNIGKVVQGVITPIKGSKDNKPVKIRNSEYWIAPDITVAKADKSRVRAFGRVWDFAGKSAEICKIDWSGP